MSSETTAQVRARLRRIGLGVPAAVLATTMAFGGVATVLPDFASAEPSNAQNSPDPALKRIRNMIGQATSPASQELLSRWVTWAEANPNSSCMSLCLAEKLSERGLSPMAIAQSLVECSVKCVGAESRAEFRQKVDEWVKDSNRQVKLSTAAEKARQEVRDLRDAPRNRALTPEQRAEANAQLRRAQQEARRAITAANTYRNLMLDAARYDGHANAATTDRERRQWQDLADQARTKAKKVSDAAGKNGDDGDATGGTRKPDRGGPPSKPGSGNQADSGSRSRGSSGITRKLGRLGPLGILLGGDPFAELRLATELRRENARESIDTLQQYLREHPAEAAELFARFQDGTAPVGNVELMHEYLADWDRAHDDSTGQDSRTSCERISTLGASCTEPRSPEAIAADRDATRDALIADNRKLSTLVTARDNTRDALIADQRNVSEHSPRLDAARDAMAADKLEMSARDSARDAARDAMIADKKSVSKPSTKQQKKSTAARRDAARDAMIADKKAHTTKKDTKSTAARRDAARDAMIADKKTVSTPKKDPKSTAARRDAARDAMIADKKSVSTPSTKQQKKSTAARRDAARDAMIADKKAA